jgi:hypothetical protein
MFSDSEPPHPVLLPAGEKGPGFHAEPCLPRRKCAGWVERSEIHQIHASQMMGFARTLLSYGHAKLTATAARIEQREIRGCGEAGPGFRFTQSGLRWLRLLVS